MPATVADHGGGKDWRRRMVMSLPGEIATPRFAPFIRSEVLLRSSLAIASTKIPKYQYIVFSFALLI
jgi:hypothetical protein